MTDAPMTATSFAEGLKTASFFEVQKIVDAMNTAREGSRKSFDGNDLMNAAKFILTGEKPAGAPEKAPKPPKAEPKK